MPRYPSRPDGRLRRPDLTAREVATHITGSVTRQCSIIRYEIYFDSLNRVGVAHGCDRWTVGRTDGRTDGQTDRTAFSDSAINSVRRTLTMELPSIVASALLKGTKDTLPKALLRELLFCNAPCINVTTTTTTTTTCTTTAPTNTNMHYHHY